MKKILLLLILLTSLNVSAQRKANIVNQTNCDMLVIVFAVCPSSCDIVGISYTLTIPANTTSTFNYNDPTFWSQDPNASNCAANWEYDFATVSQPCIISSMPGPTPAGCSHYDYLDIGRNKCLPYGCCDCFEHTTECQCSQNVINGSFSMGGFSPDDCNIVIF